MRLSLLILFLAIPVAAQDAVPLLYRFDDVRSKVTLVTSSAELRAQRGSEAHGGDHVRTGWVGYATVSAESHRARFEIYPATQVRLASDIPGVLVELERGRLKAFFDAITGNEPRLVKTPGAVLAVRGTRYGVEVGPDGRSILTVFEGTVEVFSAVVHEPLLVHAGEVCTFSRREMPRSRPMPRGMTEHGWNQRGSGGAMSGPMNSMGGSRAPMRGQEGQGSQGQRGGSMHGGSGQKPHQE